MADKQDFTDTQPIKKLKRELRKYAKLPIEVVENHDAILYQIQRAIASKHLPYQGITLVHFDSHPDLTIPPKMSADVVFDPERLLEQISIADWILPAVYAGHIHRVVWIKPEWADQMEQEVQCFYIGKHSDTGLLKVSSTNDYFVEELLYAPREKLENVKELEFRIFTLNTPRNLPQEHHKEMLHNKNQSCNSKTSSTEKEKSLSADKDKTTSCGRGILRQEPQHICINNESLSDEDMTAGPSLQSKALSEFLLNLLSNGQPYILDIDLDFFSTKNPFKELFTEEEFKSLADIYHFSPPSTSSKCDLDKCIEKRTSQLECLEATFKYIEAVGDKTDQPCTESPGLNVELMQLLDEMKICGEGDQPEYELVHSAGMTSDLPHHISTKQEIDSLFSALYSTIESIPKPTLVTMARSTYDEYTPPHQVEYIQSSLLKILGSVYGHDSIDIHLRYDN